MKKMQKILTFGVMILLSACAGNKEPQNLVPKASPYDPKDLPMVEPFNPYAPQYPVSQVKETDLALPEVYNIDVLLQKFRYNLIGLGAQVVAKNHHAQIIFPSDIVFGTNRNTLKADFKKNIQPFVDTLKNYRDSMIRVVGYTDNSMSVLKSQALSFEQAQTVVDYLIESGIEENRLLVEGKGPEDPIANNKTKEGRAKNNRIEFIVVGLQ